MGNNTSSSREYVDPKRQQFKSDKESVKNTTLSDVQVQNRVKDLFETVNQLQTTSKPSLVDPETSEVDTLHFNDTDGGLNMANTIDSINSQEGGFEPSRNRWEKYDVRQIVHKVQNGEAVRLDGMNDEDGAHLSTEFNQLDDIKALVQSNRQAGGGGDELGNPDTSATSPISSPFNLAGGKRNPLDTTVSLSEIATSATSHNQSELTNEFSPTSQNEVDSFGFGTETSAIQSTMSHSQVTNSHNIKDASLSDNSGSEFNSEVLDVDTYFNSESSSDLSFRQPATKGRFN